jgi:phosphopantetheinyl transferase
MKFCANLTILDGLSTTFRPNYYKCMPLIYDILSDNGSRILIWRITETEEALIKFSQKEEINIGVSIAGLRMAQRRKQKIVVLLLLKKLINNTFELEYTALGKPYSKDVNGEISISNTGNYVGLIYHPTQLCGLDLEIPSPKILKIAPKFVNPTEQEWLTTYPNLLGIYLVWGVKECIFKAVGGGGIDFKQHLIVTCPTGNQQSGQGIAQFKKYEPPSLFKFKFLYLDEVLMVYTIAQ